MPTAIMLVLLTLVACSVSAAPLPIRVWQFQDYNMDHIRRLVDMAADQRINRIQISHEIVMDVEEPLGNPQLVKDINTICEWAHAKNIKVDMWTHELNGIPKELMKDGKADLDDPKLWEFIKSKYDKLFNLCPGLDGLVLTMHETAIKIYQDGAVASSVTPEERVAKLIDSMNDVCKSFGKEFYVRTFSYEPKELDWLLGGIRQCKSDFVVMTKCCPHDWQPYYPFNPAIGNVGGKRQVVEFDLGHEFTGLSTIPYINLNYLKKHLDYDLSKGIVGAVLRVERLKWRATDTPNQAVIDVFSKMLLNPSVDPHKLYQNWLADRYGEAAMPDVYSAFMRTEEILNKGMYVLGYWVTNHSRLPDYGYATGSLRRRTTAKWDPSTKDIEKILHNPTSETIRRIVAEKDEALALVEQSIADIERAKPKLKPEDYAQLSDLFARMKAMVVVWKPAMEVIFGVDVYRATKAESDRRALADAADRLERAANENRVHLVNMAADYANPTRTENYDRAMGLVQQARELVSQSGGQ